MGKILEKIEASLALGSAEHDEGERAKLGTLRAGTSGVVLPDGKFSGKCPRVAHLRTLGIEAGIEPETKVMFEGGFANEAAVERLLARTGTWTKEPPTTLTLPSGLKVSGRPDLLLEEEGKPTYGVELKNVSSIWTAKDVHFDLVPKGEHLVQAAIYSLAWGKLPYSLLYSSFTQFHLGTSAPKWLTDKFAPGCPSVEFKGTRPFKILSFFREYTLGWNGENLTYFTEGLDKPVQTMITLEAIDKWYTAVAEQPKKSLLAPRPSPVSADGNKSYPACDYCELKETCDSSENNYELWLDQVRANPNMRTI